MGLEEDVSFTNKSSDEDGEEEEESWKPDFHNEKDKILYSCMIHYITILLPYNNLFCRYIMNYPSHNHFSLYNNINT